MNVYVKNDRERRKTLRAENLKERELMRKELLSYSRFKLDIGTRRRYEVLKQQ